MMSYALSAESTLLVCNCVDGFIQLALGRGREMEYFCSHEIQAGATAAFVPAIDKGLRHLGLTAKELDAVACVVGPGSFTGIRIGLATIAGLTGLRTPCAGLNLLRVLAIRAIWETTCSELWVLQHAQRGRVAMQGFSRNTLLPLSDLQCLSLEQADAILQSRKKEIGLLGSGLRRNLDFFSHLFPSSPVLPAEYDIASCHALWHEAWQLEYSTQPLVPLYLRPADAVENLTNFAARRGLSEEDCVRLLRRHED